MPPGTFDLLKLTRVGTLVRRRIAKSNNLVKKRLKLEKQMTQLIQEERRRFSYWEAVQFMSKNELVKELESVRRLRLPYYARVVMDRLSEISPDCSSNSP